MSDSIRRNDALSTVVKMRFRCDTNDIDDYAKLMFAALGMLPAVEPKHGNWIKEADRNYRWHCSECGYTVGLIQMDCNYCPHCGAFMQTRIEIPCDNCNERCNFGCSWCKITERNEE